MSRRRQHAHPGPERDPFTEWTRHLEAGISSLVTTPVSMVMRRQAARICEDESEDTLIELFVQQGVHGMPVVDRDGYLVGFVSTTDVVRARHDAADTEERLSRPVPELGPGFHEERIPRDVREIMTPVAVDLLETASLAKAALLMATYHVHQIPVVSEFGRVVGMITATDLLYWLCEQSQQPRQRRAHKQKEVQ